MLLHRLLHYKDIVLYIVSTYIFLVGCWNFEVQGTIFILRKGGSENSNFSLLYVLKISLMEIPLSLIVHINCSIIHIIMIYYAVILTTYFAKIFAWFL